MIAFVCKSIVLNSSHTHTRTHAHTRTHPHTHTRTHAHTRTRTHAHEIDWYLCKTKPDAATFGPADASTPPDTHTHTRMGGPAPMDRVAWRPQALVVALFGWRSGQRVKAARGPWAVSSAPRVSLGRSATLGRASSRVDGELLVGTACAIGLCRPRTSAHTRSLSGTSSLWRRGSCQTSPCASRCRLLLMTTGS